VGLYVSPQKVATFLLARGQLKKERENRGALPFAKTLSSCCLENDAQANLYNTAGKRLISGVAKPGACLAGVVDVNVR